MDTVYTKWANIATRSWNTDHGIDEMDIISQVPKINDGHTQLYKQFTAFYNSCLKLQNSVTDWQVTKIQALCPATKFKILISK